MDHQQQKEENLANEPVPTSMEVDPTQASSEAHVPTTATSAAIGESQQNNRNEQGVEGVAEKKELAVDDGGMEEDGENDFYHLSKIVAAHKQDVKCVLATPMGGLVTASRDESIRIWTERAATYKEIASIQQRNHQAVNSAAFYRSPTDASKWYIFAGLKSGQIDMYRGAGSVEPIAVLSLHSSNVSVLHVDVEHRLLLSGSWDNRTLVWPIDEILAEVEKGAAAMGGSATVYVECGIELTPRHKNSVWALATMPASQPTATAGSSRPRFLTGSADRTIQLHNEEGRVRTFQGHEDVVRALVVLSPRHFASAANDSTVRVWDAEVGVCLQLVESISGGEYLYALHPLSNGRFLVSAGEGGYFDIWRVHHGADGSSNAAEEGDSNGASHYPTLTLHQSHRLPVTSVWSLAEPRHGDLALATNTGQVYVFSAKRERWAKDELLQAFDAEHTAMLAKELQNQMEREEQTTVTINVALDDGQANMQLKYVKGTNPMIAAEEFIKSNNLPISYLNEVTNFIVQNVPEARAAQFSSSAGASATSAAASGGQVAAASGGGSSHQEGGATFAHYMEVRFSREGPALQLGFNLDEEPQMAAQRFVEKNKLPVACLAVLTEQVRQQINELRFGSGSQFVDPFTGGGRYVPVGGSGNDASNKQLSDPYTGGGRYVPVGGSGNDASNKQLSDPYTGGGRYVPTGGNAANRNGNNVSNGHVSGQQPLDKKRPKSEYLPVKSCHLFPLDASTPSAKALAKLAEMNEAHVEGEGLRLTDAELAALGQLMTQKDMQHAGNEHMTALEKGVQWSIDCIAPIMDCFRLALLNPELNSCFCSTERAPKTLQRLVNLLISAPALALKVFVCRALANAAAHESGRQMLLSDVNNVSGLLMQEGVGGGEKRVEVAASSAIANIAFALLQQAENTQVAELGPREDVLRAIIQKFESMENEGVLGGIDMTAVMRLLQAMGTLMWGDATVIGLAKSREVGKLLARFKDSYGDAELKQLCDAIAVMLSAV